MVKQEPIGLNSRSEANPYDINGFLPLITAPMYSVVNEDNFQFFLDNKIQVCLPRLNKNGYNFYTTYPLFISLSLADFIDQYINRKEELGFLFADKVCIDTANGNMPALHEAIRKAKELYGDKLTIMAGNVASVEAFVELAKTGCDYIRVGIGGGAGCNTTSNTGVGQEDLEKLIANCNKIKDLSKHYSQQELQYGATFFKVFSFTKDPILGIPQEFKNISKVKIVADGISSYVKQCQNKYGFNDNGYAAINKLLFAGADLVMVGKLFAQCLESAGEKLYNGPINSVSGKISTQTTLSEKHPFVKKLIKEKKYNYLHVKYSGMSTREEQKKYKSDLTIYVVENSKGENIIVDRDILKKGDKLSYGNITITLESDAQKLREGVYQYKVTNLSLSLSPGDTLTLYKRPSEGSVNWINVRWTLSEWLYGAENQDNPPYLMGWINSIKSAMSYIGKKSL